MYDTERLSAARGGGVSAHGDVGVIVLIVDAEGAKHAHATIVDRGRARGPGVRRGAAEVRAVVPARGATGGESASGGRVRDGGSGPRGREEVLEVVDFSELHIGTGREVGARSKGHDISPSYTGTTAVMALGKLN